LYNQVSEIFTNTHQTATRNSENHIDSYSKINFSIPSTNYTTNIIPTFCTGSDGGGVKAKAKITRNVIREFPFSITAKTYTYAMYTVLILLPVTVSRITCFREFRGVKKPNHAWKQQVPGNLAI
jgi:hypothetical protein